MNIESVRWLCYADKSTAQKAYNMLKAAQLGGPGKVELRRNPSVPVGWWVVTYNIICGTSHDLSRVYGIPQRVDTDSWFPYQGPGFLEQNTQVSRLIESFDVPASVEGLRKAAQEMGDSLYLCRPNVKCRDEANKRLKEIGAKEEAKPNLTTPLSTSAAGPIEQSEATSVEVVQKPKKKWWQFWK